MKRIKSLILPILAVLSALPVSARDFEYEGIWYTILDEDTKTCKTKDGVKTTEGNDFEIVDEFSPGNNADGDLVIPSVVSDGSDSFTVVSIGYASFANNIGLTSLKIPDSVLLMNDCSFLGCKNLRTVDLPDSMQDICNCSFYGCESLKDIVLPQSLTVLRRQVFKNCLSLRSVRIPDTIETIELGAFSVCPDLVTVSLPASLSEIADEAFVKCTGLVQIDFPEGLTSIGEYAFQGCSSLTEVDLPRSLSKLGRYAFSQCANLKSIRVLGTVKVLEEGMFWQDSSLETVVLPDGLESIGMYAFLECSSLVQINWPQTLTEIQDMAFGECSSLESAELSSNLTTIADFAFQECTGLREIILPQSLTYLGEYAFSICTNLKEISIPESISLLAADVFWRCSSLESVALPSSLQSIGRSAFANCSSLKAIELPESLNTIEDNAFDDCSSLKFVKIPSAITSISERTFSRCSSLESVELPTSLTYIGGEAFSRCTSLTEIVFPPSISYLGEYAFMESNLRSISIPEAITTLAEGTFWRCTSLDSVNLPNTLLSIDEGAFQECSRLTKINLPQSLTSIAKYAFDGCSGLKNIQLPSSLTELGNYAFAECDSIEYIYYPAEYPIEASSNVFSDMAYYTAELNVPNSLLQDVVSTTPWNLFEYINAKDGALPGTTAEEFEYEGIWYTVIDADARTCKTRDQYYDYELDEWVSGNSCSEDVVIPSVVYNGDTAYSVIEVGDGSFHKNELTSVIIPEGVTVIGLGAFSESSSLKSVQLPESLIRIEMTAFQACRNLTAINWPSSLRVIGGGAFNLCSLSTLDLSEGLEEIGTWAFQGNPFASVSLPASLSSTGEAPFHYCNAITEVTYSAVEPIELDPTLFPDAIYEEAILNMPNASLAEIQAVAPWNKFVNIKSKEDFPGLSVGDDFEFEGIWYTVIDTEAKTVKTKKIYEEVDGEWVSGYHLTGDLTIPAVVSYGLSEYTVIGIGPNSFDGCSELTSVSLPNTVSFIEDQAFFGCSSLISITLPSSLEEIGNYFLASCSGLREITIPEKVTKISWGAFDSCRSLAKVTLPETLTEIETNAFIGCYNLASVNMPDSLRRIDGSGFNNCAFTSIELPSALEYIGHWAFRGNPLVSVTIPASVQETGEYPFEYCNKIKEVTYLAEIPVSFDETFFDDAVYEQAALNTPNATLADIQATIPWNKFARITASDGSIGFGLSVGDDFEYEGIWYTVLDAEAKTCSTKGQVYDNALGDYVYPNQRCTGDIVIPPVVYDGRTEYSVVEIGIRSFKGSELTSVSIPEGVTKIPIAAFEECRSLTSVHLPETITLVDGTAFQVCINLSSINWPASLKRIDGGAFNFCKFESLDLPEGLEEIGQWAFQGNYSLRSVSLPAGLKSVENSPFNLCAAITEVNYAAVEPVELDATLFPDAIYEGATLNAPNVTLADIQATVPWNRFLNIQASDGSIHPSTAVSGEEFLYNGIRYMILDPSARTCMVTAPNTVGTYVYIPEVATYDMADYAVVGIRHESFAFCSELTTISIPSSVESIGDEAFFASPRLTSLIWRGPRIMPDEVSNAFNNPNLLIYVDDPAYAPRNRDYNVVAEGVCERLVLTPGYAFTPYADFTANYSIMTKEFTQQTSYDGCSGWETIVVPFDVARVSSPQGNVLLPFSVVSDVSRQRPYWLYEADPEGEWKASDGIRAGVPYLIAMPNNPRYNPAYNISGPVTFSNATPQEIRTDVTAPYAVTWTSGREFRPLWLPLTDSEAADAMGLNVNMTDLRDEYGTYLAPGSAFHIGVRPNPLEAYVDRNGDDLVSSLKINGILTGVMMLDEGDGLTISQEGAMLMLKSSSDRTVDIHSVDGTLLRRIELKSGETVYVDGLPQGVCLIAGRKFMIL